eukprot:TRINITY_DN8844_c0_g1_i1.p1 TRINITY_DN8844_c0_g1~~TRINITY_DN8844_c0_g1_i1.p1  ORF type:complete len:833 (+),score=278.06 TRINITY_DN8844_c0_g1_i1:150-2648(+)
MGEKEEDSDGSWDSARRRVKVYQLDSDGQWEDKGTGHIKCIHVEKFGGPALVVKSEKDSHQTLLLEQKVLYTAGEEVYHLQQDTLIVWNDPETDADLALSFQEAAGCKEIWDQIKEAQMSRRLKDGDDSIDESNGSLSGSERDPDELERMSLDAIKLPAATLGNVDKILETVADSSSAFHKESLVATIIRENYLPKLFELFHVIEDLEDLEHLHKFFTLFKALILLNDVTLLEVLLGEDSILEVVGILEYDPELPKPRAIPHREYLKSKVLFKEVVAFRSAELLSKIHQTFRLQYLKDVILPRALDDPTFSTFNSLIFFNNIEIVNHIMNDNVFLTELFRRIRDAETTSSQLKDLIGFLQELCNLAKNLQIPQRIHFYQAMTQHGLCDVLEVFLVHADTPVRLSTGNIIENILAHDPGLLRTFILSQSKPGYPLLNQLLVRFFSDTEMGVRVQMVEIFRSLFDTGTMEQEKDDFLVLLYNEFIPKFAEPILRDPMDESSGEMPDYVMESICDLLGFCVSHHGYRIKNFILYNNVVHKVLRLVKRRQRHLILAAVRFFRTFVGMKDDFYNRHLTKGNLFEPIVIVFTENGAKYNLINSAIIELFEFIRKENIKHLIQHVVEKYLSAFEGIDYVDTFKLLFSKHEQNMELSRSGSDADSSFRDSQRFSSSGTSQRDAADDEYFKEEADDESESSPGPRTSVGSPEREPAELVDREYGDKAAMPSPPRAGSQSPKSPRSPHSPPLDVPKEVEPVFNPPPLKPADAEESFTLGNGALPKRTPAKISIQLKSFSLPQAEQKAAEPSSPSAIADASQKHDLDNPDVEEDSPSKRQKTE